VEIDWHQLKRTEFGTDLKLSSMEWSILEPFFLEFEVLQGGKCNECSPEANPA